MKDLDIRLQGRSWTADEMYRHDELPGCLEMVGGKLCIDDDQRMLLLAALLEHIGTSRAVLLGAMHAWKAALAQRQEDEYWDAMPAVGVEQFWRPATQRLSFRQRLELKPLARARRRRCSSGRK